MVVYSKLLLLFHWFKTDHVCLMVKLHCTAAKHLPAVLCLA